jgi:hypothetical protein
MTTASKVINDRLLILNNFIEKTTNSTEPSDLHHRREALRAKELFSQLQLAIEEHTNLKNGATDPEIMLELTDKIKELAGSTMIPLVERNKEIIDNYKKNIESFSQKKIELEEFINLHSSGPFPANYESAKAELDIVDKTMINYDKAKKDTSEYLFEYERALEEITKLVMGTSVSDIIENTIQEANPHAEVPIREENSQENQEITDSQDDDNQNPNDSLQGNGVKVYD